MEKNMDTIKNNKLYKEDIEQILQQNSDWSKLKNKTILISGATGLIGTPLVDMLILLNQKYSLNLKLILISRHDRISEFGFVKYIKHDISKPIEIEDKIDFVIHASSNTHPLQYSQNPIETITTNVFGTWNLLSLVIKNTNCRFLFLSSVEIYGADLQILKDGFSETDCGYIDCNNPRSCYNESKRLSETLCAAFNSELNIDYVTARLCRVYGPTLKSDDSKAMSQFLKKAIKGEDIILKSKGNQFFSYIYSADAASALIFLLINGNSGEAYNIADSKSNITLKDLAETIAKFSNQKVIYDLPDEIEQKGFSKSQRSILNVEKISKLGWNPQFDIESGIKRTLFLMKQI